MSKATKRKHVTKEATEDYFVPEGDEEIVKILASRGNNLHEVENASGHHYLVSMPTKFRKNIWVKRGDFVVTVPIKEGNKVQGEIVYILLAKQIKYLKDKELWPKEFSPQEPCTGIPETISGKSNSTVEPKVNGNHEYSDSESVSTDDELFENPNHRPVYYMENTSDSEEEASDGDADGEDCDCVGNGGNDNEEVLSWSISTESDLNEGIARVKLK